MNYCFSTAEILNRDTFLKNINQSFHIIKYLGTVGRIELLLPKTIDVNKYGATVLPFFYILYLF